MNKIAIIKDKNGFDPFEGEEYIVDLDRKFEGYAPGDLICSIQPFQIPLTLDLAIRADGSLVFRSWSFDQNANEYLHTYEISESDAENQPFEKPFIPTSAQVATVNGLWSGRILFEGLKLPVGASVLRICPIDIEREQRLAGKTIYLA